jgi:multimeric flavodoxin WrbA/putative sterol carrier protein
MKVMAINSSPRSGSGESKTELMLNSLIEGMRQAGAEVELVNLREKKVRYCQGCFSCWTKTPGVCIHKDDMTGELFPKWIESDLAIYASPLYHFHVNAHMKTFIERTLPMLEPYLVPGADGATHHPLRYEKFPAAVFLSVAGFPEMKIFDQLSSWARYIYKDGLRAEIYRPAAELLATPMGKRKGREILQATAQAGKELVGNGAVSSQTMEAITQPMGDPNDIGTMANMFWRTCLTRGITPREANKQNLLPTPGSLEDLVLLMPAGFNGDAAGDLEAMIQYDFSGPVEGSCHFKIAGGEMSGALGKADDPTLTIAMEFDLWIDILMGKVEGQEVFMQGKAKASGDLGLLMRFNQLFGDA